MFEYELHSLSLCYPRCSISRGGEKKTRDISNRILPGLLYLSFLKAHARLSLYQIYYNTCWKVFSPRCSVTDDEGGDRGGGGHFIRPRKVVRGHCSLGQKCRTKMGLMMTSVCSDRLLFFSVYNGSSIAAFNRERTVCGQCLRNRVHPTRIKKNTRVQSSYIFLLLRQIAKSHLTPPMSVTQSQHTLRVIHHHPLRENLQQPTTKAETSSP